MEEQKKRLVINPYMYKAEGIEDIDSYMDALCNSFDTYVLIDENYSGAKNKNVEYVEKNPRRKSYLEVTADYIIDAGAISGTNKLSYSQKRVCIVDEKIIDDHRLNSTENICKTIDYSAPFDLMLRASANVTEEDVNEFLKYRGPQKLGDRRLVKSDELLRLMELEKGTRALSEVLFLVDYVNKDDEIHESIDRLATMFKKEFGARIYMLGERECDFSYDTPFIFDRGEKFDLKISSENNPGTVRNILLETNGVIIIYDRQAYDYYKDFIKGKPTICLFKDGSLAGERRLMKQSSFFKKNGWELIFELALNDLQPTPLFIEERLSKESIAGINTKDDSSEDDILVERRIGEIREHPLVSVIIPFFNDVETIGLAVDSIRDSGYDNCEIIIVNDGSCENPLNVIKRSDEVRYFYKENGGPGSARNLGMSKAKGKYLLFLDADDVSYPGGIGKMVEFSEKNGLKMTFGKTIRRYVEKGIEEEWYGGTYARETINEERDRGLLIDDTLCHGKLYDRLFIETTGITFPDGIYEDAAFMSRVYSQPEAIGIISDPVQIWNVYGADTSLSTDSSFKNVEARLDVVDAVYKNTTGMLQLYYTRQYVRHQIIACLNNYRSFSEKDRVQLYERLKEGIKMRETTILDRLILMPSKKELYKALLKDDYERFDSIAKSFSEAYRKTIS